MRHILVTGGAGFVGAAVLRKLVSDQYEVIATWHRREPTAIDGVRWVKLDLANRESFTAIEAIEAIVHTAAAIPINFANSGKEAALNRRIDDLVFDLAGGQRVPVIYASTTSVYGPQVGDYAESRWDETTPLSPNGPYAEQKALSEERGREAAARYGFTFVALRLNAPYGPGQLSRNVMQIFVERALKGEDLLYLGSGSREQDFTFIDDLADAFARSLAGPAGIYNIAGSAPISMADLARTVAAAAGLGRGRVRASGLPDPQEGWRGRFDLTKARENLGWTPRTSLREGIERMVAAGRKECAPCGSH